MSGLARGSTEPGAAAVAAPMPAARRDAANLPCRAPPACSGSAQCGAALRNSPPPGAAAPVLWATRACREDLPAYAGPWPQRVFLAMGSREFTGTRPQAAQAGGARWDALLARYCEELAALLGEQGLGPDRLKWEVSCPQGAWCARGWWKGGQVQVCGAGRRPPCSLAGGPPGYQPRASPQAGMRQHADTHSILPPLPCLPDRRGRGPHRVGLGGAAARRAALPAQPLVGRRGGGARRRPLLHQPPPPAGRPTRHPVCKRGAQHAPGGRGDAPAAALRLQQLVAGRGGGRAGARAPARCRGGPAPPARPRCLAGVQLCGAAQGVRDAVCAHRRSALGQQRRQGIASRGPGWQAALATRWQVGRAGCIGRRRACIGVWPCCGPYCNNPLSPWRLPSSPSSLLQAPTFTFVSSCRKLARQAASRPRQQWRQLRPRPKAQPTRSVGCMLAAGCSSIPASSTLPTPQRFPCLDAQTAPTCCASCGHSPLPCLLPLGCAGGVSLRLPPLLHHARGAGGGGTRAALLQSRAQLVACGQAECQGKMGAGEWSRGRRCALGYEGDLGLRTGEADVAASALRRPTWASTTGRWVPRSRRWSPPRCGAARAWSGGPPSPSRWGASTQAVQVVCSLDCSHSQSAHASWALSVGAPTSRNLGSRAR